MIFVLRKISLILFQVFLGGVCLFHITPSYSQDSLVIWKKQLNVARSLPSKEYISDLDFLHLVDYTYKSKIKSEEEKKVIIDSLISDNSLSVLHWPPIVVKDTIVQHDFFEIKENCFPRFEIVPVSVAKRYAKMRGEQNPIIQLKQKLDSLIKVGFEVVTLDWCYKNTEFRSICIVSNDYGIIYDPIGSCVITGTGITQKTK